MRSTKVEYRNSFDTLARTIGPYSLWNVANEVSNTFNNDLHGQLRRHLNDKRSSIRPPRQYRGPRDPTNALRCYMVGLTKDRASPHVAILCKEKWFCTQARHVILESGLLQDRGWRGCIRLSYEIRLNGATSPAPKSTDELPAFQESTLFNRDQHNVAISYYPKSTSGLRIAVSGFNGDVRMATLGGFVEINEAIFGLTVSHVFSTQTPSYEGNNPERETDFESFVLDQDDLDPFVRITDSDEPLDVIEQHSDIPEVSEPSEKPTPVNEAEDIKLSTPIDDDSMNPFIGQRSGGKTARWSLGSRETFGNDAAYESEWALISIDSDDSSTGYDMMANLATTTSDEKLPPTSAASKMAPTGTRLTLAAPRGETTVIAIGSESSVQLTSCKRYLGLWTVRLDRAEDGDCGSWIINHVTGELFGMLAATCEDLCEAYILPIKDIFTEIETLSDHSVKLPALDPVGGTRKRQVELTEELVSISLGESNPMYPQLRPDSIRILNLLPGNSKAEIYCELLACELESPADYDVLCYVSSRSGSTSSIRVNGQWTWVDSSLSAALKNLRYIDRPRTLWVDALCTNPADIEERNNQVSFQAPIMLQARSVCIWLGKKGPGSRWAFSYDSISSISNLDSFWDDYKLARLAKVLAYLIGRAWFHPSSVQAICLASHATIHCGRDFMPWKVFVQILKTLQTHTFVDYSLWQDTQDAFQRVNMLFWLIDVAENSIRRLDDGQIERMYSLESLLMQLFWLKPTTEHDAIYSMLSMARDVYPSPKLSISPSVHESPPPEAVHHISLEPTVLKAADVCSMNLERRKLIVDYSQPFEGVCKDFVQLAIQSSQSLDILCRPWAPLFKRLPSWVPQCSQAPFVINRDNKIQRVNGDLFITRDGGPGKLQAYDASRLKRPNFCIFSNSVGAPLISVEGFILDAIHETHDPALMGNIPPGWVELLDWEDTNKPPPDKAWRTLVGDRGHDVSSFPPADYRRACEQVFRRVKPGYGLHIGTEIVKKDPIIEDFLRRVQVVIWGRRLIKTERHGFLGLAPRATKERDVVAILYGLSVPVVLRQVQDTTEGDNMYEIVGECFIYGMMDGQALWLKEVQGIHDQTFVLQ